MEAAELNEVLRLHKLHLEGDKNGKHADLQGAYLRGADLQDAKINYLTIGLHPAPEGKLRAWKKVGIALVELIIPEKAKRSCATTRKHRAEYAKVVSIDGKKKGKIEHKGCVYECGKIVRPDSFDENRWNECSNGIHFFLTKEEAETWE